MKNSKSNFKTLLLIILVAFLTIGLFFLINTQKKRSREENNLRLGKQYYSNQQYETAIDYFNLVLKDNAKNVEAYYFKTNAFKNLDNINSAISVAEFGYKVTNAKELKTLKDDLIIKSDNGLVVTEQTLVSNHNVDFSTVNEVTTIDTTETLEDLITIELTPEVSIPEDIPTLSTTIAESSNDEQNSDDSNQDKDNNDNSNNNANDNNGNGSNKDNSSGEDKNISDTSVSTIVTEFPIESTSKETNIVTTSTEPTTTEINTTIDETTTQNIETSQDNSELIDEMLEKIIGIFNEIQSN